MAGSGPGPGSPRWQPLIAALLAVIVCAAFSPALDVFIAGDDFEWLDTAYEVIDEPLSSFRIDNNFFRPYVKWSYLVDYLIFGQRAVGYMLTNLAIHFANSLLLYWLLRRRLQQPLVAAAATAAFALSPLHSEGVLWGAGRPDTILPVFFLAAILLLDRWCERPTSGLAIACTAVAVLGLGAKESWIIFPFIATAYPPLVWKTPMVVTLRRLAVVWAAWLVYVAVLLVVPAAMGNETAAHYADFKLLPALHKTASTVFAYFGLGFAPFEAWVVAVAILIAIFGTAWLIRTRDGFGLWAMVWLCLTLAISAPYQVSVLRHNYMPLLGFWMVVASFVDQLVVRTEGPRRRLLVAVTVASAVSVILVEAAALQLEIKDYRFYGDLHRRLCESYAEVGDRISRESVLVLVDRSRFRGVEYMADHVRGVDKTFFVRRDALWQMVFLPPLANFVGQPFEERLVRERFDPGTGIETGFTLLLFNDDGFSLRPDLRNVLVESVDKTGGLPPGVSLYRFTAR